MEGKEVKDTGGLKDTTVTQFFVESNPVVLNSGHQSNEEMQDLEESKAIENGEKEAESFDTTEQAIFDAML